MALFKKKPPPEGGDSGDSGSEDFEYTAQPEKAQKWFEHARTAADSSNYDYALSCYASGLIFDPEIMSAHEAMFEVAIRYANQGGRSATGREIRKIEEPHSIGRFVAVEFTWMKDITNANLALKALEASIKADQLEWGNSIAIKVLGLMRKSKKLTKSTWLKAMYLFSDVHAYDQAMIAGEQALALDPRDSSLDHELKNISAQRAMDQGRYEEAGGKEGGFRGMVKDMDKQRELEEMELLSVSASTEERNLERARLHYEKTPEVPDVINKYTQLLKRRGTPESIKKAQEIYLKGYEETKEYRFRMNAGDIDIGKAMKVENELRKRLDSATDNGELQQELEKVRRDRLQLESSEFLERVKRYPNDRSFQYRLGEVFYQLGDTGKAMEHLQNSKDEPRLRARASHMLGSCFAREQWYNEAIEEFKEALQAIEVADRKRELDIRYDLMLSLIELARAENDPGLAREARDICSNIARKNIGFRDIRQRRSEVGQLLKDIAGSGNEG